MDMEEFCHHVIFLFTSFIRLKTYIAGPPANWMTYLDIILLFTLSGKFTNKSPALNLIATYTLYLFHSTVQENGKLFSFFAG